MSLIDEKKLNEEIDVALRYYESDSRKNYSNQRIDNGVGNLKSAMAAGIAIINKTGSSLFPS